LNPSRNHHILKGYRHIHQAKYTDAQVYS